MWPCDSGPARPRPRRGDRAPRSLASLARAPGAVGRGHSTPSFVCSRLQGPLPCRPPPTGRPPGPHVPSPAGGARTEDGAEENSRTSGLPPFLQGEGQIGLGAPRAGPPERPVVGLGARLQVPRLMPTSPFAWGCPSLACIRGGLILGHSPVSSTLGPVRSFFQELPSLWGPYPCVPLKTPARHVLVWGGVQ